MMRTMLDKSYVHGIKRRNGVATAHEVRIVISDPTERVILGKLLGTDKPQMQLTAYLPTDDFDAACRMADQDDKRPRLKALKRAAERIAANPDEDPSQLGQAIAEVRSFIPGLKAITARLNHDIAAMDHQDADHRVELMTLRLAQLGDAAARAEIARRYGNKPAGADTGAPCTIDMVIAAWSNEYRERDHLKRSPSADAIRAKRGILEYMFEARGKAPDLRLIDDSDLKEHRRYLLSDDRKPGKKGRLPNAHDHVEQLKTCFAVAERNNLIAVNPAAKVQTVSKAEIRRLDFTDAERTVVLLAAREADPQVRWAHWISAFTSAIPSELRWLTPAHFGTEDGVQVVDIKPPKGFGGKTQYRPRTNPLHPALVSEGLFDYVETVRREGGADAPLFPMNEGKFSLEINAVIHTLKAAGKVEDDPLKSFYSHRHTVLTKLDGREVYDDEGRKVDSSYLIGGHAAPNIHKKHYVHVAMSRLMAAVKHLPAE